MNLYRSYINIKFACVKLAEIILYDFNSWKNHQTFASFPSADTRLDESERLDLDLCLSDLSDQAGDFLCLLEE